MDLVTAGMWCSNKLLWDAAANDSHDVIKACLQAGAHIETRHGLRQTTPLIIAAELGNLAAVETLISHTANLEQKDSATNTALKLAAENGHSDVVDILLASHAHPDKGTMCGTTPLIVAVWHGHTHVAEVLLKGAANIHERNNVGETALIVAASHGKTEMIELLIKRRATIEGKNRSGATALMAAAANGHTEVVETLLYSKANLNEKDGNGHTAFDLARGAFRTDVVHAIQDFSELIAAVGLGLTEVATSMIQQKANLEERNSNGETALFIAALDGNLEMLKLLLSSRADCEARNSKGCTALLAATWSGHAQVVNVLLTRKADPQAKGRYGQTPLDIARHCGGRGVARALESFRDRAATRIQSWHRGKTVRAALGGARDWAAAPKAELGWEPQDLAMLTEKPAAGNAAETAAAHMGLMVQRAWTVLDAGSGGPHARDAGNPGSRSSSEGEGTALIGSHPAHQWGRSLSPNSGSDWPGALSPETLDTCSTLCPLSARSQEAGGGAEMGESPGERWQDAPSVGSAEVQGAEVRAGATEARDGVAELRPALGADRHLSPGPLSPGPQGGREVLLANVEFAPELWQECCAAGGLQALTTESWKRCPEGDEAEAWEDPVEHRGLGDPAEAGQPEALSPRSLAGEKSPKTGFAHACENPPQLARDVSESWLHAHVWLPVKAASKEALPATCDASEGSSPSSLPGSMRPHRTPRLCREDVVKSSFSTPKPSGSQGDTPFKVHRRSCGHSYENLAAIWRALQPGHGHPTPPSISAAPTAVLSCQAASGPPVTTAEALPLGAADTRDPSHLGSTWWTPTVAAQPRAASTTRCLMGVVRKQVVAPLGHRVLSTPLEPLNGGHELGTLRASACRGAGNAVSPLVDRRQHHPADAAARAECCSSLRPGCFSDETSFMICCMIQPCCEREDSGVLRANGGDVLEGVGVVDLLIARSEERNCKKHDVLLGKDSNHGVVHAWNRPRRVFKL